MHTSDISVAIDSSKINYTSNMVIGWISSNICVRIVCVAHNIKPNSTPTMTQYTLTSMDN